MTDGASTVPPWPRRPTGSARSRQSRWLLSGDLDGGLARHIRTALGARRSPSVTRRGTPGALGDRRVGGRSRSGSRRSRSGGSRSGPERPGSRSRSGGSRSRRSGRSPGRRSRSGGRRSRRSRRGRRCRLGRRGRDRAGHGRARSGGSGDSAVTHRADLGAGRDRPVGGRGGRRLLRRDRSPAGCSAGAVPVGCPDGVSVVAFVCSLVEDVPPPMPNCVWLALLALALVALAWRPASRRRPGTGSGCAPRRPPGSRSGGAVRCSCRCSPRSRSPGPAARARRSRCRSATGGRNTSRTGSCA